MTGRSAAKYVKWIALAAMVSAAVAGCGGARVGSGPGGPGGVSATIQVPSGASTTLVPGATLQLAAISTSGLPISGPLAWRSSNTAVATVDAQSGLVTAVAPGTTQISVSGANVLASPITITVTSAPAGQVAAVVVTPPASTNLNVGDTLQLQATAKDASGAVVPNATITWSSSNPSVATVSSTGLVTAVAAGTVSITAAVGSVTSQPVNLTVAQPAAALSFATDIKPLTSRCDACHPAIVPSTGAMSDYNSIIAKGYVKPGDPQDSPFYTKPAPQTSVSHGGGKIWGSDAQTVFNWIQQGAKP